MKSNSIYFTVKKYLRGYKKRKFQISYTPVSGKIKKN